ncbi:isoprenyl transferase [Mesorhizobium sp. LHD-90]|uniref:isoprenyl transferase n=1 Tax=Mesorhizobium sp. LHD-90 TaxID=3071414 RepID=UPI0027E11309|nr:isoprenyl transferase [Mesorhizobium sp. LHD-90]MDQ6437132.1 isoprenyl transferase [Mesorhizobium sp. LHD-90]
MTTPAHVAIIMDGNGRWAKARGLPRLAGHKAGVEALRQAVRTASDLGVSWLTVYAFSSENWSRPASEVSDLLGLLKLFIRRDLAELHRSGVKVHVIGERQSLQPDIRMLLDEAESLTAGNRSLNLVIAFNYGGRDEIVRAARKIAADVAAGRIDPAAVTEQTVSQALDTRGIPDPDLVIRTSGEMRLSNFLLWQAAYSELVFLPCLWPDFGAEHFEEALRQFRARERRFGGRAERDVISSSA